MTYEEYRSKRNELSNSANNLISDGKFDEAEAAMQQMTDLDNAYDRQTAMEANLRALEGNQRKVNIQNLTGAPVANAQIADSTEKLDKPEDAFKSETYLTAWAKVMMGKQLTAEESKAYAMVNEAQPFTHTTENTSVLIPASVANGIWKEIGEKYPYYEDTMKTYIKGKAIMIKAKSSTNAKWYVESVKTEDGKELFDKTELNGCELSRAITVSWKLREMAIADFIPYITSAMADEMGKGLAYGVTHGAGVIEGHAPEPLGVVTALEKESGAPHITEYSSATGITYDKLIEARSKVKSGYRPALYCNSNMMWNSLAALVDGTGRPLLMADASTGTGVYRVLGCVVKEDDSMDDGEILFSDAKQYQVNINRNITVTTEEHNKDRVTDYCGYAIVDGAPITTNAHSLLKAAE